MHLGLCSVHRVPRVPRAYTCFSPGTRQIRPDAGRETAQIVLLVVVCRTIWTFEDYLLLQLTTCLTGCDTMTSTFKVLEMLSS